VVTRWVLHLHPRRRILFFPPPPRTLLASSFVFFYAVRRNPSLPSLTWSSPRRIWSSKRRSSLSPFFRSNVSPGLRNLQPSLTFGSPTYFFCGHSVVFLLLEQPRSPVLFPPFSFLVLALSPSKDPHWRVPGSYLSSPCDFCGFPPSLYRQIPMCLPISFSSGVELLFFPSPLVYTFSTASPPSCVGNLGIFLCFWRAPLLGKFPLLSLPCVSQARPKRILYFPFLLLDGASSPFYASPKSGFPTPRIFVPFRARSKRHFFPYMIIRCFHPPPS